MNFESERIICDCSVLSWKYGCRANRCYL